MRLCAERYVLLLDLRLDFGAHVGGGRGVGDRLGWGVRCKQCMGRK